MSHASKRPFSLDDDEVAGVRAAFDAAGFDETGVAALCGASSIATLKDVPGELALARTAGGRPLDVLTRLFVIGAPHSAAQARAALAPLPLDRWVAGGLLRVVRDEVVGAVKMTPYDGLLLAFDRGTEDGEAADHVMGPSDSARRLANLTPRRPCEDSLDLGTGCGLLALLLARHSQRVVATDVNPRAVAFTELNARLSGVSNLTALCGDLFAPVAGRRFDLVVSNPPFVISPEDRLVYLTGGMKADAFCQRVAAEAPSVLADDGWCQMLCNWVELEGDEWSDRLRSWFEGSGCDTWVLRSSTTDPASYARAWIAVGSGAAEAADPARLAAWLRYYEEERIGAIGGGVVTMRKRAGKNWFRAFDAPQRAVGPAWEAVVERMPALGFLDAAADDAALMASVLAVSPDVRLVQECRPTKEGWAQETARVRVVRGLAYEEEVDTYFGELIVACDGRRTLAEAMEHTAARLGQAVEDAPAETAAIVRQLVEEGFLGPCEPVG